MTIWRGRAFSRGQHSRRQRFASRDEELLSNQVQAADQLGHTVFDLEPGVDLQEVEAAIAVVQELGRGRIPQAH